MAGSSVAAGACVAGAAPPQAERIMLAKTSKLSNTNSLRIFFLLLTKFEGFIETYSLYCKQYHLTETTTSFRTQYLL
jgi:hypothetical protein